MWSFLVHSQKSLAYSQKSLAYFFTPHHTNNHRPKSLHPSAFLLYILFFILLEANLGFVRKFRPDILGIATDVKVDRLLSLTNQKRMETGLAPLSFNQELSQAADKKAADMFAQNYWAHNGPSGRTPWEFIKGAGYQYLYAGENLAKDFNDSDGIVFAWMESPTHRDNILKPEYKDVGFAVVNGDLLGQETTLVVQMFGAREVVSLAKKEVVIPPVAAAFFPSPIANPTPVLPTPTSYYLTYNTANIASEFKPAGVVHQPLVDMMTTTRNISISLDLFLIGALVIDGLLIWRRKTVRISGHNFAHIIFLASLFGIIWLRSLGTIL